jgi:hypothetical protein
MIVIGKLQMIVIKTNLKEIMIQREKVEQKFADSK